MNNNLSPTSRGKPEIDRDQIRIDYELKKKKILEKGNKKLQEEERARRFEETK